MWRPSKRANAASTAGTGATRDGDDGDGGGAYTSGDGALELSELTKQKLSLASQEHVRQHPRYREFTIQFNSDVSDKLPWRFKPLQHKVRVVPN